MRKYIDAFTVKRYTGIFIILAVVTAFSLIVNVTIAYLGDKKDKTNTVKVGYGEVSIDEQFSEPSELKMTNDITKQVKIQNNSTVPAFVRVYAEFSDSSIASQAKVKYGTGENDVCSWAEFKEKLKYNKANFEEPFFKDLKWRYVPADDTNGLGGYFYYTEALSAYKEASTDGENNPVAAVLGGETEKLFDSVFIDYNKYVKDENDEDVAADSNIDRIQPVEMIVYTELIQTVDTGTTKVTTTTVDEDNNPIPATTDEHGNPVEAGNPQESSEYGYDYAENNEWEKAWRRFLKLEQNRVENVNVQQQTPEIPEPNP